MNLWKKDAQVYQYYIIVACTLWIIWKIIKNKYLMKHEVNIASSIKMNDIATKLTW